MSDDSGAGACFLFGAVALIVTYGFPQSVPAGMPVPVWYILGTAIGAFFLLAAWAAD